MSILKWKHFHISSRAMIWGNGLSDRNYEQIQTPIVKQSQIQRKSDSNDSRKTTIIADIRESICRKVGSTLRWYAVVWSRNRTSLSTASLLPNQLHNFADSNLLWRISSCSRVRTRIWPKKPPKYKRMDLTSLFPLLRDCFRPSFLDYFEFFRTIFWWPGLQSGTWNNWLHRLQEFRTKCWFVGPNRQKTRCQFPILFGWETRDLC